MALAAAFGTLTVDSYALFLGFPKTDPAVWETHGSKVHVRVVLKLAICGVLICVGFALLLGINWLIGDKDPATALKLARDDYTERKKKVKKKTDSVHGAQLRAVTDDGRSAG